MESHAVPKGFESSDSGGKKLFLEFRFHGVKGFFSFDPLGVSLGLNLHHVVDGIDQILVGLD